MRVVVVYKDKSDHAREVIDFIREYKMQTGHDIETIDPETLEGEHFCEAYDVVEYPTILALSQETGSVEQAWRGRPLPQIEEVGYYA